MNVRVLTLGSVYTDSNSSTLVVDQRSKRELKELTLLLEIIQRGSLFQVRKMQ